MNILTKTLLSISAIAFLAGCYDTSSPKDLIESAAKALKKNDDKLFLELLIGEAKVQFSNPTELANLKAVVGKAEDLKISQISQTEEKQIAADEIHRSHEVSITKNDAKVMTVKTTCILYYGYTLKTPKDEQPSIVLLDRESDIHDARGNERDALDHDNRIDRIDHEFPDVPRQSWGTSCRITSISK